MTKVPAKSSAPTADLQAESPAAVMVEAAAPEVEPKKSWKRAVVVAGGGRIPADIGSRMVVVVEARDAPVRDDKGAVISAGELRLKGYAQEGDIYYRTSTDVQFPDNAPIFTLTQNVASKGTGGFYERIGGLSMGPGHPAYAGANLAYQHGARDIEIVGLSAREKETLQPWFDSRKMPGDLKVTLS